MNRADVFRGFPNVKMSMSEPWQVYTERTAGGECEGCTHLVCDTIVPIALMWPAQSLQVVQLTDWPLRKNEHSQKRDGLSCICSLSTFSTFRWNIPLHSESPLIFLEAFVHAFSSKRHTNALNMFHLRNHGSSCCNYPILILLGKISRPSHQCIKSLCWFSNDPVLCSLSIFF